VAAALSACGLGILMGVLLVSPPRAGRTGLMQQMLIPMRPPAMDHITLGVGNEEVNEKTANWALKVPLPSPPRAHPGRYAAPSPVGSSPPSPHRAISVLAAP